MHPELSAFAARLRRHILAEPTPANPRAKAAESSTWAVCFGEREFTRQARELFALQVSRNEVYRRVVARHGVRPEQIADWREIPAMPAAAFKEFAVTCLAPGERTHEFHSSGTTASRPGRHYHDAESLALYEASLWPWFARHLMPEAEPIPFQLLVLTPPPHAAPHSSLVHMFDTVRRRMDERAGQEVFPAGEVFLGQTAPDRAWGLDWARTNAALQAASRANRPVLLLGTAFSFVHLLEQMKAGGLRGELPLGSRVMETGGYKGRSRALPRAELHAQLHAALGIPPAHIVGEYGMCELSSQAYDRVAGGQGNAPGSEGGVFRFAPWARAWVVSPETGQEVADGETGLLRICDLANVASVLAIQTEDLAVRRGDGFELLGRARAAEPRGCSLQVAE